jgi:hypothetical protein
MRVVACNPLPEETEARELSPEEQDERNWEESCRT